MHFVSHRLIASILAAFSVAASAAPVHLVDEAPVSIQRISPDIILVDFGKVSFGNIQLTAPSGVDQSITVHYGEDFKEGRVNRKPLGTVRYVPATASIKGGTTLLVSPPADARNTKTKGHPAVLTPPEWGVILPFRWVEIEGWTGELKPQHIVRKSAFASTWNDDAAHFESSDATLNRIWEFCKYSIKATTFAGVYVDGDRERIPYEADAYINQLCHYYTDSDVQMARDTFDWLMKHPTWPTEWAFHMIFMAHADHRHTGDTAWLATRYESLRPKLLLDRAREDGLLVSNAQQVKRDDIVDWPKGERDGFVFKPVNTVVNAFHIRSLQMMADLARALGKGSEAAEYDATAAKARQAFQKILFNPELGAYRDGDGTDHASQHASLFPLAFGLVAEEHIESVAAHIAGRGMACSVYAAQYLMDALFANGKGTRALELMTAPGDRSWRHMVDSGSTISWEAWDHKYKSNQDWNHAWGAAPANLLPRFVLGIEAAAPGWSHARIRPFPGDLAFAKGRVPTPRGPIEVDWKNAATFEISVVLPAGTTATLELPAPPSSTRVSINGTAVPAKRLGGAWHVKNPVTGSVKVLVE
jgi:alpha-L-rhamnosidase